jgi:hypothetical protein
MAEVVVEAVEEVETAAVARFEEETEGAEVEAEVEGAEDEEVLPSKSSGKLRLISHSDISLVISSADTRVLL